MTNNGYGWLIFIAAIGMTLTLLSVEVTNLEAWESATSPVFIGKAMAHVGTVIGAFIAGKLVPSMSRD